MELKDLGLTKEEIFDAVVNKVASELLRQPVKSVDEDGEEYDDFESTPYHKELRKHIKTAIDSSIQTVVDTHVLPRAEEKIESIVIQKTNSYGEPKGEPLSFVEYLTKRAEEFMLEGVDYQGKPKGTDSYGWRKNGTRIAYMIDQHLQYHIENWAKTALAEANKAIVGGLNDAVRTKLQEIVSKLKIDVKV
jgi:hypothetical protein